MSKLQRAREAAKRARDKAKEGRREALRRVTAAGTGFAIGSLERSGAIESVPELWGLPRTVTLAGLAAVGGMFTKGTAGDLLDGIADGSLAVAAYQMGARGSVSGTGDVAGMPGEIAGLPGQIAGLPGYVGFDDSFDDNDEFVAGYEDELDAELEPSEFDAE